METSIFEEKVTRQDLVDYVVNKKVTSIEETIPSLVIIKEKMEENLNHQIKALGTEIFTIATKNIKSVYGKMITLMEKNLKAKSHIIFGNKKLPNKTELSDGIAKHYSIFHNLQENEVLIVFYKIGGRPSDNSISTILIDISELSSPKLEKIKSEISSLEVEIKKVQTEINNKKDQICNIKKDRDKIKGAIIEELLGKTPEGKRLLTTLENIQLGKKLIG